VHVFVGWSLKNPASQAMQCSGSKLVVGAAVVEVGAGVVVVGAAVVVVGAAVVVVGAAVVVQLVAPAEDHLPAEQS
jgi:ABC-type uncharacterized transport system permease subunit